MLVTIFGLLCLTAVIRLSYLKAKEVSEAWMPLFNQKL